MSAIVTRIFALLSLQDNVKVLVFSQWKEVLEILTHALDLDEIDHMYLSKGRQHCNRALSEFKASSSARVLLMPLSFGGNGLNLVEVSNCLVIDQARWFVRNSRLLLIKGPLVVVFLGGGEGVDVQAQHVVMIEPSWSIGAEMQAIHRVNRIGQTRSTCVHRFLINNTVEGNIFSLNRYHLTDPRKEQFTRSNARENEIRLDINDLAKLVELDENI